MVTFLGFCLWVMPDAQAAGIGTLPDSSAGAGGPGRDADGGGVVLASGRTEPVFDALYTQPENEQALILHLLDWDFPEQPPARIDAKDLPYRRPLCGRPRPLRVPRSPEKRPLTNPSLLKRRNPG